MLVLLCDTDIDNNDRENNNHNNDAFNAGIVMESGPSVRRRCVRTWVPDPKIPNQWRVNPEAKHSEKHAVAKKRVRELRVCTSTLARATYG